MYYQLFGEPGPYSAANYGGIDRCSPSYDDQLSEDHPANRAFLEYTEHDQRLASREEALRLAEVFREIGKRCDAVAVELAPGPPAEPVPGLIGYDIAHYGWYSLLASGLRELGTSSESPTP